MRLSRAALLFLIGMCACGVAMAQAAGGLAVKVVDSEGIPLPGARVVISHVTAKIKTEGAATDKKGFARFPVLPAGAGYVLEISFPGFGTRRETNQRVEIGKDKVLVVQLAEEMTEVVKVVATQPVVDLEKTTSGAKFSDEFVQDLPVPGRFYQNVLTLAPGVNDADGDGNPTVHGSRSRDFRAVVSGVSNVDPLTGQFMSLVNPNSIEEMEVITGGASVAFGRAQGGFANIVQKQGTNEYEGVFDFLLRTSKLDGTGANDFDRTNDPDFQSLQGGVSFSGPLVKDKLWFRLAHDFIDNETPVNTLDSVAITTSERRIDADQITWQVSPRNKLVFQYQSDPLKIGNFGISSLVSPESALTLDNQSKTYSLNWTAPYSTKVLVNSTFAFQELQNSVFPGRPGGVNDCLPSDPILGNSRCTNGQTGEVSGPAVTNLDDSSERFTMSSQATLYGGQFWGGSHQFKFGFSAEGERYFRRTIRNPDLFFLELSFIDSDEPDASPELIRIVNAQVSVPGESNIRSTGNNWAVYFEDQYKPLSNLTLTFGARVDREEIDAQGRALFDPSAELQLAQDLSGDGNLTTVANRTAFTIYEGIDDFIDSLSPIVGLSPDELLGSLSPTAIQTKFWDNTRPVEDIEIRNTNFSPFFSVKWDPWSNGKNAFGASYRRYYDKIVLNVPLLETTAPTTNVAFNLIPRTGDPNLDTDGDGIADSNDPDIDGDGIPNSQDPDQGGFVSGGVRNSVEPTVNIQAVDRNLRTPYQDEFRLTYEREIFTETALALEYTRRDYRDQLQDIDVNRAVGDFGRCTRATASNNDVISASPGTGDITDDYTGEVYFDSDPGRGDGRLDDCAGDVVNQFNGAASSDPLDRDARREQPDGVTDLYIQNPAWGSIFVIGNNNFSDYEGFVVSVTRRQYRSWEMQGSYTWSQALGNGEDFAQAIGDDPTLLADEFGFQSNDQRHVVRMNATTITPWGFRLGATMRWESGLPYSIQTQRLSFDQVVPISIIGANGASTRIVYPSGVRNDERNKSFYTFDMKATKELNIGRGLNLQLSAEVFNLLNDDTLTIYNNALESGRQINGQNEGVRRFGRQWQVGMKLAF